MTIRKSTLAINIIGMVVILAAVLAISLPFLFNGFRDIENSQTTDLTNRAVTASNNMTKGLGTRLYDWANWDDTYRFVTDKNKTFIASNFNNEPHYDSPIFDIILFYDSQQNLVYSNGPYQIPPGLLSALQPGSSLLKYSNASNPDSDRSFQAGYIMLDHKIAMVASRPILKTDGSGPSHGTLLFVQYFEADEKNRLDGSISPLLSLYELASPSLPPDVKEQTKGLTAGTIKINAINNDLIAGYAVINDVFDKPAIALRVEAERKVNHVAIASIKADAIAIIILGIFIAWVRQVFFQRLVVNRLSAFTKRASQFKGGNRLDERIPLSGNDEITELGRAINSMLDHIAASQSRISELLHESKHYQRELQKEKTDVEKLVAERTLQLEEETNLFAASINSLPLGFMITDVDMNILKINPQIKTMLTEKELTSSAKDANQPFMLAITKLLNKPGGKDHIRSLDFTTNNGRFLHVVAAPVVSKKSGVKGYVVVVDDVTEKRLVERSKDEFFSIASHELRTPLTAIRGNSSMLIGYHQKELKKLDMDVMVDDIYTSSVRLIEIVNDFLDVSRLEQGRMKFETAAFDISKPIKEVLEEMDAVVTERKLYLHYDKPEKLPLVQADQDRIKQVVYNLIGNALKFTEKGGVTLSVKADKAGFLKVSVTDTGRGISRTGQQLLFHKFQQTGSSLYTRDNTRGTGLGLYISKLIVEQLGGAIQLEHSEEGTGSTFSFTLPVAK